MRAADGCREGAGGSKLRPIFMKLHVTASFRYDLGRAYRSIVARARRFSETVVAETPSFCDEMQHHSGVVLCVKW